MNNPDYNKQDLRNVVVAFGSLRTALTKAGEERPTVRELEETSAFDFIVKYAPKGLRFRHTTHTFDDHTD